MYCIYYLETWYSNLANSLVELHLGFSIAGGGGGSSARMDVCLFFLSMHKFAMMQVQSPQQRSLTGTVYGNLNYSYLACSCIQSSTCTRSCWLNFSPTNQTPTEHIQAMRGQQWNGVKIGIHKVSVVGTQKCPREVNSEGHL